jgi:hypothetical protein
MTTFEHQFEVNDPPEAAWRRMTDAQPPDLASTPRQWWLPGFDSTGEEIEVDAPRTLTVRKDTMPCADTTIRITFEHTATGTRITVVQSGFDEGFIAGAGVSFWIGAAQIGVDAELFFTTGVKGGRHGRPFAFLGCGTTVTPVGLAVDWVMPDTYAARAGYKSGDLMLTVAGAPIVGERDLVTVSRMVQQGSDLTSTLARGGERLDCTAVL